MASADHESLEIDHRIRKGAPRGGPSALESACEIAGCADSAGALSLATSPGPDYERVADPGSMSDSFLEAVHRAAAPIGDWNPDPLC